MAGERTRAETCASLLKKHGGEAEINRVGLAYGQAKAEVDAVIAGLTAALATTNVTVLTSSSAEEKSFEDERWQNGAFTEVFLEALSRADTDRNGLISVTDLTSYLTTHVPILTENKQTPGIEVRFQSDIFVAEL